MGKFGKKEGIGLVEKGRKVSRTWKDIKNG